MQEPELIVIMPVYNEEDTIKEVVQEWHEELSALRISFELHVINDGSKDNSLIILRELQKFLPYLRVHDQVNMGHGHSILHGYKTFSHTPWLFQVDSDNEVRPESFHLLWDKRNSYDLLIGQRSNRQNPLARQIVSAIARLIVRFFFGGGVSDVNSPFRLMRTDAFREVFPLIPDKTFAPNVIVTGIACRKKSRIYEVEIPYQFRQTGKVSISKMKLIKAAWHSGAQTIRFIWYFRKKIN
jgi:glycosyltransferase involved in cell wall biosynthesis